MWAVATRSRGALGAEAVCGASVASELSTQASLGCRAQQAGVVCVCVWGGASITTRLRKIMPGEESARYSARGHHTGYF